MLNIFLIVTVAFVMGAGGLGHLIMPEFFGGFVFEPLPSGLVILLTGLMQCAIAIAVLIPRTRALAGLIFAVVCTAYLPLHIWDLFRPDPVIAPLSAAIVRIIVQFGFIWAGWALYQRQKSL